MELRQPHNAFFKETFGRVETAVDFLHNYLPPDVLSCLKLDGMELQKETFIDPNLQEHYSDLLYSVPLSGQSNAEEDAYVYILFEHKSNPEVSTPFQLLRYMVRVWERSRRLNPRAALPPILPIVFYHGTTPWRTGTRFADLYFGPDELRSYWPDFTFQVTDLTQFTDEQLKGKVLLRAALRLMKHIADARLHETLPGLFHLMFDLVQQETGLQYLETFLRYIAAAGHHVSRQELRQIVVNVFSQRGGAIVGTIAEQLIEEGIEKGIEKGIEIGRQEGLQQSAQVLRNSIQTILRARFSLSDADVQTAAQRLSQVTDLSQLEQLLSYALHDLTYADFERRLR